MEITSRKKREIKIPKSFGIEDKVYNDFKKGCEDRNISMSEVINSFIKEVNEKIKNGEGEIIIKIK